MVCDDIMLALIPPGSLGIEPLREKKLRLRRLGLALIRIHQLTIIGLAGILDIVQRTTKSGGDTAALV